MPVSIEAVVWAFRQQGLSPTAKLVLVSLAEHCTSGGECWPAQGRLAAACGLARETINRHLRALATAGLIVAEQRINGIGQLPNRYFLRCDSPSQGGVTQDHTRCDAGSQGGVTQDHTEPLREEPLREEDSEEADASSAPHDPVKDMFDRGIAMLGNRRSLIGKMRKQFGDVAVLAAIAACEAEQPSDPVPFFIRCCEQRQVNGHKLGPVSMMYLAADEAIDEINRERAGRNRNPAVVPLLGD